MSKMQNQLRKMERDRVKRRDSRYTDLEPAEQRYVRDEDITVWDLYGMDHSGFRSHADRLYSRPRKGPPEEELSYEPIED